VEVSDVRVRPETCRYQLPGRVIRWRIVDYKNLQRGIRDTQHGFQASLQLIGSVPSRDDDTDKRRRGRRIELLKTGMSGPLAVACLLNVIDAVILQMLVDAFAQLVPYDLTKPVRRNGALVEVQLQCTQGLPMESHNDMHSGPAISFQPWEWL
jgi:hypothetical protein